MKTDDENEEQQGFWSRVKAAFSSEDEESNLYNRRLIDNRIERYLDRNFDSYIDEYGLVREMDLKRYDERYDGLSERIEGLKGFMKEADAEAGNLEGRIETIKMKAKRGK